MDPKVIDYSNAFLKLNISGKRYKILKSTAQGLHGSLFSELTTLAEKGREKIGLRVSLAASNSIYLVDSNEFYFERSSIVFDYLLQYVYSGRLHCPNGVCKEMLLDEMEFWRVISPEGRSSVTVTQCCSPQQGDEKGEKDEVDTLNGIHEEIGEPDTFLGKVWLCCEDPSSSVAASITSILSIFFILVSIVNLILSTVKALHHCPPNADSHTHHNNSNSSLLDSITFHDQSHHRCEGGPIFDLIEAICIGWFTMELIVRFIACPNKLRFFQSPMNIIDMLATIPFYIEIVLWAFHFSLGKLFMMYVFRLIRILRIMRALRLARYFDSVRMMGETFRKCRKDLGILLVFLFMATIIASSVVYYFERDEEKTQFTSIPMTFWWCVVTLTTVGYGDFAPTTSGGRFCAGVVCVAGIILMAMPISIMVENFSQTYKNRQVHHNHAPVRDLLKRVSSGGTTRKSTSSDRSKTPRDDMKYKEDAALIFVPKKRSIS